jgi:hypothetical protein
MKTTSILAMSTLFSSPIVSSSLSSSLRGSAANTALAPAPESIAVRDEQIEAHRELLLPDQTCYEIGLFGNSMAIPCDYHVLSDCYTYPQCADTQQDALASGASGCPFVTVWNNTVPSDPPCPWQYMCCFYTNANSTI